MSIGGKINSGLRFLGLHVSRVKKQKAIVKNQITDLYPNAHFIGPLENYVIGDKVTIGLGTILFACEKITIGDNAMIAVGAIIHTSTHDYNAHPMWKYRIDRPVTIGKYAWIGAGAIILPGVTIGDNSVVGAGSVVTANVPEGAIVAGNPARIVRLRKASTYKKRPEITEFSQAITKKMKGVEKNVK